MKFNEGKSFRPNVVKEQLRFLVEIYCRQPVTVSQPYLITAMTAYRQSLIGVHPDLSREVMTTTNR